MKSTSDLPRTRESASPLGDATDHRPRFGAVVSGLAVALALAAVVGAAAAAAQGDPFFSERHSMVDDQVRKRGIEQRGLLQVMEKVPRHLFVPEVYHGKAYDDLPVEIAPGQTLSQAFVSARMISLLDLRGDEKVLEIGTGSGYDAALLSRLVRQVYTVEIDRELAVRARQTLGSLGYGNVKVRIGDGYRGWAEEAPFDAILVTAAPRSLPQPLIDQLKVGGRMVIAVGSVVQDLQVITKTAEGLETRKVSLVNLSPMTGEVREQE